MNRVLDRKMKCIQNTNRVLLGNYRIGKIELKLYMQFAEINCHRGLNAKGKLKRSASDSFLYVDIRFLFRILTPAFLRKVVSGCKVRLLSVGLKTISEVEQLGQGSQRRREGGDSQNNRSQNLEVPSSLNF